MDRKNEESKSKVTEISLATFTRDVRDILGLILQRISELEGEGGSLKDGKPYPLQIRFTGQELFVQTARVPFHARPLSSRLIGAFFEVDHLSIPRKKLLDTVYGLDAAATHRLRKCAEINLNKLVSRTRQMIEASLTGTCWSGHLDWLVYDNDTKSWKLYQVREFPRFLLGALDHQSLLGSSPVTRQEESPHP